MMEYLQNKYIDHKNFSKDKRTPKHRLKNIAKNYKSRNYTNN